MENLFKTLLKNYMNDITGIEAVSICDRNGFIIASESRETAESDSVIGVISAVLDSYMDRIKSEFGTASTFFNITTTGAKKFSYCSQGPHSILTTIADQSTPDTELKIYSEHIASKVELLIEGNQNVSLEIPEIVRALSKTRTGALPDGDISCKLILTGDFQVGKTSLIKRFVENKFQDNYISTIGVEITKRILELGPKTKLTFVLWDIGGQKADMASYRKRFYSGANGAFIVIDRTRPESAQSVEFWYNEINEIVAKNIPIVIVGNKSDLVNNILVSEHDIKNIAAKYDSHYILSSAKTGENVNDVFSYIAFRIISNM